MISSRLWGKGRDLTTIAPRGSGENDVPGSTGIPAVAVHRLPLASSGRMLHAAATALVEADPNGLWS